MTYRKSMSDAIREVQESTIKPYVSMSMGGQYNVLDKDSKVVYSTRDKTLAYDYFKKNFDKLKEEVQELDEGANHQQDLMRRADKYNILMKPEGPNVGLSYLGFKNNKGGTTKTVTKGLYYNSLKSIDQLKKDIDAHMKELQKDPRVKGTFRKEEVEQVTENNLILKAKEIAKKFADSMSKAVAEIEKLEKGLSKNPAVDAELRKYNEDVSLQEVSDNLKLAVLKRKIKQYKDKVFKKTMSTIKSPLFAGYEEVEEGRMKDIFTAGEQGKSAEEIAKLMKLPLKTVKNILGEEVFEEQILEFTSDMITRLQKSYSTMPKRISPEQATALSKHLDRLDLASLKQLTKAKIPFVTALARNKVYKKTGKFEEVELEITEQTPAQKATEMLKNLATAAGFKRPSSGDGYQAVFDYRNGKGKYQGKGKKTFKQVQDWIYRNGYRIDMGYLRNMLGEAVDEPKQDMPDDKEQVAKENSDKEIASLKDQIAMLKTKLENEKNKAVKPEPNPKTGEVPLTVGIAHKHFKDQKEKEEKKEVKENVSIKAYKNAVDPTKKGLMISKSGGMSGTIMIKDKKELKQLEDKIAQAKKLYNIKETAERDKRIQRAKDMIKFYDKQKKAALKGKNKDLAKKMLKNDSEDEPREKKKETPPLDTTGVVEMAKDSSAHAIGMSQAMKSTGDKPPLDKSTIKKGHKIAKAILNKEEKRLYIESIIKKIKDKKMSYLKHKPGSIEELVQAEASKLNDSAYQDMFKKELDKAGKGIGGMSPKEKKDFFNKIDDKYKAKSEVKEEDAYDKDDEKPAPKPKPKKEELSAAQKKLPAGLQKAIKDKETKSESLINTYESLIKTWEAASHKMPDGTMMKGAKHKDETKDEANDVDNGDEKKPVATKDVKKLADSGSKLTKVETEPEADFKN